MKGVDTKSEASHSANDISRKVKKHVPGKPTRRMGNQSSLCRQCAPLVVSVLLLRPLGWLLEKGVQNSKCLSLWFTTNRLRSIGSQFSDFLLERVRLCQALAARMWEDQHNFVSAIKVCLTSPPLHTRRKRRLKQRTEEQTEKERVCF